MDRDKRWDRIEKAYKAIVGADAPRFADAAAVIADAYGGKKFDEFIVRPGYLHDRSEIVHDIRDSAADNRPAGSHIFQ